MTRESCRYCCWHGSFLGCSDAAAPVAQVVEASAWLAAPKSRVREAPLAWVHQLLLGSAQDIAAAPSSSSSFGEFEGQPDALDVLAVAFRLLGDSLLDPQQHRQDGPSLQGAAQAAVFFDAALKLDPGCSTAKAQLDRALLRAQRASLLPTGREQSQLDTAARPWAITQVWWAELAVDPLLQPGQLTAILLDRESPLRILRLLESLVGQEAPSEKWSPGSDPSAGADKPAEIEDGASLAMVLRAPMTALVSVDAAASLSAALVPLDPSRECMLVDASGRLLDLGREKRGLFKLSRVAYQAADAGPPTWVQTRDCSLRWTQSAGQIVLRVLRLPPDLSPRQLKVDIASYSVRVSLLCQQPGQGGLGSACRAAGALVMAPSGPEEGATVLLAGELERAVVPAHSSWDWDPEEGLTLFLKCVRQPGSRPAREHR